MYDWDKPLTPTVGEPFYASPRKLQRSLELRNPSASGSPSRKVIRSKLLVPLQQEWGCESLDVVSSSGCKFWKTGTNTQFGEDEEEGAQARVGSGVCNCVTRLYCDARCCCFQNTGSSLTSMLSMSQERPSSFHHEKQKPLIILQMTDQCNSQHQHTPTTIQVINFFEFTSNEENESGTHPSVLFSNDHCSDLNYSHSYSPTFGEKSIAGTFSKGLLPNITNCNTHIETARPRQGAQEGISRQRHGGTFRRMSLMDCDSYEIWSLTPQRISPGMKYR